MPPLARRLSPVIADLHAHYPMHLVPQGEGTVLDLITSPRARWRLLDRARAGLVEIASRFANYESFEAGPRVTVPLMRDGGVRVALSVLYSPFDELDLRKRYPSPPDDGYLDSILRQAEAVERDIADSFADQATVAHEPAELDAALAAGKLALIHCVEGGFHLGGSPESIDRAVTELARRGTLYITLAHLIFRGVATNSNAIPFLADPIYHALFPQPRAGLTELGRAAVRAMVRERVLVDVTHMSRRAFDETLALLDALDPDRTVPVIASHAAYRFGADRYNLSDSEVRRIAARDGVIGLILAEHQAANGLRWRHTRKLDDSLEIVFSHLDRFRQLTGSHRHSAIGTDLDGFIKPTLAGLEDASRLDRLEAALVNRYGEDDARLIASDNVVRLLRTYWRGGGRKAPAGAKEGAVDGQ